MPSENQQSNNTQILRVFLCHSSQDKPAVRKIYQWLQTVGVKPWFDEENLLPGQHWLEEIPKAVRAADVVLVCLSRNAVDQAGYAQKEIKLALDLADMQPEGSIFVIPVRLEECNIPERLRTLHWVNLFEERGYERLMGSLRHRADQLGRVITPMPSTGDSHDLAGKHSPEEEQHSTPTEKTGLRPTSAEKSPPVENRRDDPMADTPAPSASPPNNPGLVLRATLRSKDIIGKIAWSPDGRFLAAALSYSNAVYRWDATTGIDLPALIGHSRPATCVAWAPHGQMLASGAEDTTIRIWDLTNQQTNLILDGHASGVRSVAWSPDSQILASGSKDTTVRLWSAITGQVQHILEGHERAVNSVVWSPDGQLLASAAEDTTIRIWDSSQGQSKRVLAGHTNTLLSMTWSPDGQLLASASADKTVGIWNAQTGRQIYVLEGHTGIVTSVSFSADGWLLASKDTDDTVRIWRTDTWEPVALLDETSSGYRFASLAFHPSAPILATSGEKDFCIHTWELQNDVLLGLERGKAFQVALVSGTSAITPIEVASGPWINMVEQDSRSYTNAKVVLVGDSGVGKTALSLVLTQQPYEATDSSYGRHVWIFERDESEPEKTRETMLWDLAGQPGFRLIHQLYLTDVAVALVVFDARSEIDPFAGVRYWDRALRQAQSIKGVAAVPMKKFLVAARTDRGGIPVNRKQIDTLIRKLGFDGYFETSAKEGLGIQALIEAIRTTIDWQVLPNIQSNDLFQQIKGFLTVEKSAGKLLSTSKELYRGFLKGEYAPEESADLSGQFKTCIGLVESRGLVRHFSFGDLVLLQPELLDAYASALIMAARNDPDGMGCIPEDDTRQGLFPIPEDVRIRHPKDEELLLIATIEDLLRHEIALREQSNDGALLVFPSQLTFEREDAPEPEGEAVAFTFEGAVLNIYATLAVRLAHSGLFRKQTMWKNATTYTARVGGICGMVLEEIEEGRGELTIFFNHEVTEETRFLFDEYVHTHLQRRALPEKTRRRRIFACSACTTTVTDQMVRMRRARGFDWIDCPVCGTRLSLLDGEERMKAARAAHIHQMDQAANTQREREMAKSTLAGKQATNDFDVFLCYNRDDEQAVKEIDAQLLDRGIWPWLAERQQRPGVRWQHVLDQDMKQIKTVAVFVGKSLKIPWQNIEIESFLRDFITLRRPVIPVLLPDVKDEPELPMFLSGLTWVDFRKKDYEPLEEIIQGVTNAHGVGNKFYRQISFSETSQIRSDIEEIRLAIGNKSIKDYERLAKAIIRRMGAIEPRIVNSRHFTHGTIWEVSLSNIKINFQSNNKAIIWLRQKENSSVYYKYLQDMLYSKRSEVLLVIDVVESLSSPTDINCRVIWLQPVSLKEMITLTGEALQSWLNWFIATRIQEDVKLRPSLLSYQTRGHTELFFGREKELDQLSDKKVAGGIIIGAHRSGKTSLLYQLKKRLEYRSGQVVGPLSIGGIEEIQDFFERTLEALSIYCPSELTIDNWANILRPYSKRGEPVSFLLDEVDALLKLDATMKYRLGQQMRSLQNDGVCKFYMAGHEELRKAIALEGGPFRNFAQEVVLAGLSEHASIRLIREPIKSLGFDISQEHARRVFQGTAGVAVLIQEFCARLLSEMGPIDERAISEVTICRIEESPEYLRTVYNHYEYSQDWLSQSVMILAAIRRGIILKEIVDEFNSHGISLDRDRLDERLDFLVSFGILEEVTTGYYRILSDYLRQAIEGYEPISLLESKLKEGRSKEA